MKDVTKISILLLITKSNYPRQYSLRLSRLIFLIEYFENIKNTFVF